MTQLKYLTDNIDELDAAEHDLEANGVPRSHIHVLSNNENELVKHNIPTYSDWSKRDVAYYGLRGAAIGAVLCICILGAGVLYGLNDSVSWAILSFIAVATMGFCTWEGGLMGISKLNHAFEKYRSAIENGEHLLVIDTADDREENAARFSVEGHPVLRAVD